MNEVVKNMFADIAFDEAVKMFADDQSEEWEP